MFGYRRTNSVCGWLATDRTQTERREAVVGRLPEAPGFTENRKFMPRE